MSTITTTTSKLTDRLHRAQLGAAEKAQDVTVAAAQRLSGLRQKAPQGPQAVTRLIEPWSTRIVSYAEDWSDNARSFATRMAEATQGSTKATPPKATKKA